jgi:hypothetical protein
MTQRRITLRDAIRKLPLPRVTRVVNSERERYGHLRRLIELQGITNPDTVSIAEARQKCKSIDQRAVEDFLRLRQKFVKKTDN